MHAAAVKARRRPRPDARRDVWTRKNGRLYCEAVAVEKIASTAGTPVYIYSARAIEDNFRAYAHAFEDVPHSVCYSVKANPNLAVLALLGRLGAGFDIVSAGELQRVTAAGGAANRVVFSGVGKTSEEIGEALAAGILLFNAESEEEIAAIGRQARARGVRAPLALRVNPDVDAKTHPYISTGLRCHKFGVDIREAERLYARAARHPALEPCGVSCHIGSQILDLTPFEEAFAKVLEFAGRLRRRGLPIRFIDIGGGLGIPYRAEESRPDVAEYARRIGTMLENAGVRYHLLLEPGRSIVAEAGTLVTRVLYRKNAGAKKFVIVDAAMNDLMRPALYGAWHEIRPVVERARRGKEGLADVVGPICESTDFFAKDRPLPDIAQGQLLAIFSAGAYGSSLGSSYNTRPRPAEVLVEGQTFRTVRSRESRSDVFRNEQV